MEGTQVENSERQLTSEAVVAATTTDLMVSHNLLPLDCRGTTYLYRMSSRMMSAARSAIA